MPIPSFEQLAADTPEAHRRVGETNREATRELTDLRARLADGSGPAIGRRDGLPE
jgi:hypothetical protein